MMDETTPLCEECGYDLTGLMPEGACPECGRPVARSLPESRPGSPWQFSPGSVSWLRTNLAVLRGPAELFASVRIDPRGGASLLVLNVLLAALLLAAPWTGTLIGDPIRGGRGGGPMRELLTFGWVFPAQVLGIAAFLVLLTMIEFAGIRFIAARRKWRLTRAGAWQVCCHASVGWIILGVAPLAGLALVYTLGVLLRVPLGRTFTIPATPGWRTSLGTVLGISLPIAGLVIGLLVYELLVHIGVRKCRYAATLRVATKS
ncbi:MAG: hypothetical protein JNK25_08125 [Phycisphaerae bacterium]|nr:hypothetical protein [Phycisphaerae bacterium]